MAMSYVTKRQYNAGIKIRDLREMMYDEFKACQGALAEKVAFQRAVKALDNAYRAVLNIHEDDASGPAHGSTLNQRMDHD